MYASYTRFRVKKWWAVPFFQVHAMRSAKQAKTSIGLLKMDTIYAGGTDFCTLTVWESKEQMLKFRDTGAHAVAMRLSSKMGEGYTTGWECDVIPDKELAEFRLKIRMNVIGKQDWLVVG